MMRLEVIDSEKTSDGRLADLYRRHAQTAVRLAYLLTGDPALAEDLSQEAFVRVAGRLVAIRDPDAFGGYLRQTVVNLVTSHMRRTIVERRTLRRLGPAEVPESGGVEDRDELWQALLTLPVRQRAAIVLRFYLDLSEADTAEMLRCRPGTVKSLVSRALDAMREQVTR